MNKTYDNIYIYKYLNWCSVLQATFIPAAEALDTSYFMSRYIWNPDDELIDGGSDFDDMSGSDFTSCSESLHSDMADEVYCHIFCNYLAC